MLYAIAFYWIVCGLAFYGIGSHNRSEFPLLEFLFCMIVGGICIPARLIIKVAQ